MRLPRQRSWGLAVLLGLVVLGGWLAWRWETATEPLFQGRSRSYWFPQWTREAGISAAEELRRRNLLANAGPEVIPVLLAAAGARDTPVSRRYSEARRAVPAALGRSLLPVYREAAVVQYGVTRVLKSLAARPDGLSALTNAWAQFPAWAQVEIVTALGRSPQFPEIAEPFLFRVLHGTDGSAVGEAAVALRVYPQAAIRFDELAAGLARLSPSRLAEGKPPLADDLTTQLVELGPRAAAAVPMLEAWLASETAGLRACAAIALPAVAPERYDLARTVDTYVIQPKGALLSALSRGLVRRTRAQLHWGELVPPLIPVLEKAARAPVDGERRHEDVEIIFAFLEELGPEGIRALPAVLPWLQRPHLDHLAARVVARMGPGAPETIPALVPALTNDATAIPILLLLSAYGPAAREAVPALERLVAREAERTRAEAQHRSQTSANPGRSDVVFTRDVVVWAGIAGQLGLTNAWPSPQELGAAPGVVWAEDQFRPRSTHPPPPAPLVPGTIRMESAPFERIIAHALRRIRG